MSQVISQIVEDTQRMISQAEDALQRLERLESNKRVSNGHAVKENRALTEQTQTAPRNKNREANQAAVELLIESYPNTFSLDEPKPLKIGIQDDLVSDEKVSRGKIKRALATYVRNPRYLSSMVAGVQRVDLTGADAGEVTADDEKHAKAKLDEYKARRKERINQQRKEQRNNERDERISNKLEALVAKTKRR